MKDIWVGQKFKSADGLTIRPISEVKGIWPFRKICVEIFIEPNNAKISTIKYSDFIEWISICIKDEKSLMEVRWFFGLQK
jgi:hypothetical protein